MLGDYFLVSAFARCRNIKHWCSISHGLTKMYHLPDLFDIHNVKSAHYDVDSKDEVSGLSRCGDDGYHDNNISVFNSSLLNFAPTKLHDNYNGSVFYRAAPGVATRY